MTSTPITTVTTPYGFRPDVVRFPADDVVPQALVLRAATVSPAPLGDQPSVHVPFLNDAGGSLEATGTGATFTPEGTEITALDPGFDEVEVRTHVATRMAVLSREQFNQGVTASLVASSFQRDITRLADHYFLNDATDGIVNQAGITEAEAPVTTSLDPIVDLLAELEVLGAEPSVIIVDPLSWAALRKLKIGTSYALNILGAGTDDAQPRLLSLPVLRSRYLAAGTSVVVDASQIAAAVGPVEADYSEHAAFTSRGVVLRTAWRIGHKLVRPARTGLFTIDGVTAGS